MTAIESLEALAIANIGVARGQPARGGKGTRERVRAAYAAYPAG